MPKPTLLYKQLLEALWTLLTHSIISHCWLSRAAISNVACSAPFPPTQRWISPQGCLVMTTPNWVLGASSWSMPMSDPSCLPLSTAAQLFCRPSCSPSSCTEIQIPTRHKTQAKTCQPTDLQPADKIRCTQREKTTKQIKALMYTSTGKRFCVF